MLGGFWGAWGVLLSIICAGMERGLEPAGLSPSVPGSMKSSGTWLAIVSELGIVVYLNEDWEGMAHRRRLCIRGRDARSMQGREGIGESSPSLQKLDVVFARCY